MITNGGLSFSLTQTFYLIQPSTYFEQLFKIATYSVLSNIASLSNIKNVLWWFLLLWPNWPQIPKASRSLSSSAKETINELQRATHYPGKWICLVLTGYLTQNIIHQVLGFQWCGFHLCSFSKNNPNIQLMQFLLHNWRNSLTHAFLVAI